MWPEISMNLVFTLMCDEQTVVFKTRNEQGLLVKKNSAELYEEVHKVVLSVVLAPAHNIPCAVWEC